MRALGNGAFTWVIRRLRPSAGRGSATECSHNDTEVMRCSSQQAVGGSGRFSRSVIWIAIAFWPARVAARKGHSFLGYFIFSLIFFPLALIVAYLVSDRAALA